MKKALAASGLILALLGGLAMEVAAQTSCSGWRSKCLARCKEGGATNCPYCAQQTSNCRKTGCWTENAQFGGATHCNLQKK
jgi:hypothetical protein